MSRAIIVSRLLPFLLLFFTQSLSAQTTVAPNLMIIFGNGYSMNRWLNDANYGYNSTDHQHFNDTGLDAYVGTPWLGKAFGQYAASKMYISKNALASVLNNTSSANINFGFATFRQTFGMEVASATLKTKEKYTLIVPNDSTIFTKTTADKQAYGYDYNNFGFVYWNFIGVGGRLVTSWDAATQQFVTTGGRSAELGIQGADYNQQVIDDSPSVTSYTSGGVVKSFKYKPNFSDQTSTTSANGTTVWYDAGATGNQTYPSPSNPTITWKLCRTTYLSSSNNTFEGLYIGDRATPTSYSNLQFETQFMPWGNKYDANGKYITSGSVGCPAQGGQSLAIGQEWTRVSNENKWDLVGTQTERDQNCYGDTITASGKCRIYFSGIGYYDLKSGSGVPGVFTGWSGETTYKETNSTNRTGVMTATYPSGSASPYRDKSDGMGNDRKWVVDGEYQQTTANHMGVFLDLPDPAMGYIDQRGIIKRFMRIPQMSDSGLEYDPASQTIANNKGIAASTYAWGANQSPIYDSLQGALAYYTAYKAVDPFDSCRSNNILIFFDGKEDAHWRLVNGQQIFVNPSDIATQLLAIGVKTYVVILSNNAGDISDANAIAVAGGTNAAYAANSASSLLSAFQNVVSGLSGELVTANPAFPRTLSGSNNYAYVASQESNPTAGHFKAYQIDGNGVSTNSAVWDAADLMTVSKRQTALWSNQSNGTMTLFNSLDDAAFAAGPRGPATIKSYTFDPSTSGGMYLSGRKSGSLLGGFSDQAMAPLMLQNMPYSPVYLADPNYAAYVRGNATITKQVLFPNDDGFLYSINAASGELAWGWMPRPLVASLNAYTTFWTSGPMRGGIAIADAPVSSSYATYVLGTGQSGALHYALRLDNAGNPAKVSWVNQNTGSTSPGFQAPVVTYLNSGVSAPPYKTYANYIGVNGTTSTLYTQEVADSSALSSATLSSLTQPVTSTLAVDQGSGTAKLYFGDKTGGVWFVNANAAASTAVASLVKIGTHYSSKTVRYVGAYRWDNKDYVWSASDQGVTVYTYSTTLGAWKNVWESHVGGAGKWDVNSYTAGTTGSTPSATGIQSIPSNYSVTASPIVEKGVLIVPIGQTGPGGSPSCAGGNAYYYFYRLADGFFPKGSNSVFSVVNSDGSTSALTGNLYIGQGTPKKPTTAINGGDRFVFGIAQQPDASGNRMPAVKSSSTAGGTVSWRELIAR